MISEKMFSFRTLFGLLMLGLCAVSITGECNSCSSLSNRACVSKTEWQFCSDHSPAGEIFSCGEGSVCGRSGQCEESKDAACNECNVCSSSKVFACTGTNKFALCLGTDTPSQIAYTCTDGLICNNQNPNICSVPKEESYNPTCSYEDDPQPPTSPSPYENPDGFCAFFQTEGRLPIGNDDLTTCRQYIQCIKKNDQWIGAAYYCPGSLYFDSTLHICVNEIPSSCSRTKVTTIALLKL